MASPTVELVLNLREKILPGDISEVIGKGVGHLGIWMEESPFGNQEVR